MALPALLSGADCGPSNPLQALSKQFDRDRGVQQDHFGVARPGPSREVFRTQPALAPGLDQDAARFFSGQGSVDPPVAAQQVPNAFDLSALRGSLPQPPLQLQPLPRPLQSLPPSAWASDFLSQHSNQNVGLQSHAKAIDQFNVPDTNRVDSHLGAHILPMSSSHIPGAYRPLMQPTPIFQGTSQEFPSQGSEATSAAMKVHFPPEEVVSEQTLPANDPIDNDELARTAGLLVETVKHETNPKFQNSAFLGLMRQLRDREMVVEGTDIIENSSPTTPLENVRTENSTHSSTHGGEVGVQIHSRESFIPSMSEAQQRREMAEFTLDEDVGREQRSAIPRKSVHFDRPEVEDAEDAFWRQENEEYKEFWKTERNEEVTPSARPEWDKLQDDWESFEATATGVKPVSIYHFQPNNPYFLGESSTRNHTVHMQRLEWNKSILEKEAVVQNDLRNAGAWFELGVKQQENEREAKAIQALERAVQLDPSHLPAWLALAISHTNENDRSSACDAIENWLRNNGRYEGEQLIRKLEKRAGSSVHERHEELVQCLLGLARTAPEGEVDADIQTALGVLLNTSEEYEKAYDCFRTALDVFPNDWLLYNRVGATLANSGRPDEALWYYHRALELNPSYIRARFNLGISCINMKSYTEAAEHILDALSLQEDDASGNAEKRGVTSLALWDCLRTACLQMQRSDLTAFCDTQDLDGFRKAYVALTAY